jgi:hypothetical protein
MIAQNEKNLGLASAIRALTDEEFRAAIEDGKAIGVGAMLRDAHAVLEKVATEDVRSRHAASSRRTLRKSAA